METVDFTPRKKGLFGKILIAVIVLFLWAFGKHSKKSKENYAKAALVWVFIWTLIGFTIFTVFWGIINGTL